MRVKFYQHKILFVLTLFISQFLHGQNCVSFSNLPSGIYAANSGYPLGTSFHNESGASIGLAPFHFEDGSIRNNVSIQSGTFFWSGAFLDGQGQVIRMLEASVDIDFTQNFAVADDVSISFFDWEGDINLSINGEPVMNARSFNELPTQIASFVTMTVDDSPTGQNGRMGVVSFSGPIYSMTIGGIELGIDNICFSQGIEPACTITHVTAEPLPCDESTGNFNMLVDFNGINTSGAVNITVGNASFGPFPASQAPFTVGPFPGNGTGYVVEVSDNENPNCSNIFQTSAINCSITACNISNLTAAAVDCAGDFLFDAVIDFDRNSSPSDQFEVTVNGVSRGTFHYSLFPLTLTLSGDGPFNHNVLVCDAADSNCCLGTTFNGFECAPVCNISAVTTQVEECDNGEFNILVGLSGTGFGQNMFVLLNDDDYGEFPSASFPITVGPLTGDGITEYRFDIFDSQDFNCFNSATVAPVFCEVPNPCIISDLTVNPTQCNGINEYGAVINFNNTSSPSNQFEIRIDGNTIGFYPANSFPLTLNNLQSEGIESKVLTLLDVSDATCILEVTFQTLDCRPECSIDELVATPMACNPNDQFMIQVDLAGTTLDNPIQLSVNGQNVGQYTPAEFPVMVGPYQGDGNSVYHIVATDVQLSNCTNSTDVTAPQCEPIVVCEINNLEVVTNECTGDNLQSITIDFDHTEVNGGNFSVFVNNDLIGNYSYFSLPLTLNSIPTNGVGTTSIFVSDIFDADCFADGSFETINCSIVPDCSISDLSVEILECTGEDTYSLLLDFTHANTGNSFNINLGNTTLGPISYNNLPLTINNVANTSNLEQTISVCDIENPNCCQTLIYTEIDCSQSLCNISEVTSERMSCSEGMFMVMLNASFINPGSDGFQVSGNGTNYGNFEYASLPIMLGPFEGDGNRSFEFTMTDLEDPSCNNFTTVDAYNCMEECVMGEVQVSIGDCQLNGMVPVTFFFESDNNSGAYSITQNNTIIATLEYADGPATILLDGTSLAPYNMTIRDTVVETCTNSIPVGPFGCIATASRETELQGVKVFVSEETERLNISVPVSNAPTNINVYNINGQRIMKENFGSGIEFLQMDISFLNSNIYVVEIIQDHKRSVRKFHRIK
jgi:hypothetical protein